MLLWLGWTRQGRWVQVKISEVVGPAHIEFCGSDMGSHWMIRTGVYQRAGSGGGILSQHTSRLGKFEVPVTST